ncbi:MAG: Hpt domain-containing protein [Candidatus Korobacteraceae bacterium]
MSTFWDRSTAVQRLGGDEALLEELIQIFFEDYSRLAERLSQGLSQGDLAAVREAAHTLKGSLAYLGATDASARALEIETAARLAEAGPAAELVRKLMFEIEVLRQAMTSPAGDPKHGPDIQ